jgi:hypothetical protein
MCVFRSGATTFPAWTEVAKTIFATETQYVFVEASRGKLSGFALA